MYVTVHRGTQQIGGNLVEIGAAHTRLLFLTREPICRLWTVRKQRTPLNWRD